MEKKLERVSFLKPSLWVVAGARFELTTFGLWARYELVSPVLTCLYKVVLSLMPYWFQRLFTKTGLYQFLRVFIIKCNKNATNFYDYTKYISAFSVGFWYLIHSCKKQEPRFIKLISETSSLPPEEFWGGYNGLIKVLVNYYKSKNDEDE